MKSILAAAFFFVPRVLAADEVTSDQVDRVFVRFDKPNSPGCSVAVMRDGEIIHADSYGMANLEYDVPISPSTVFHVASVSKQFTSFAIALLAAEGKLSLEDDVRKYLPELADFGHVITIHHLMNHTSGLRDQWSLLMMAGWRLDDVITEGDILELLTRQRELNFTPGERYTYSNAGYTLLAVIVERVSGQPLRVFANEHMFEPLGMINTHFHDDHRFLVKNRADSYEPIGERGFQACVLSYANVGATSLFTTVEDLALWQQNFVDPIVGGPEVIEMMLQRGKLNNGRELTYASGLEMGRYRGLETIGHSGGDAGFRSYLVRFPSENFSIAILSNAAHADPQGLTYQLADLYLADQCTEPSTPADTRSLIAPAQVTLTESALGSIAGLYRDVTTRQVWSVERGQNELRVNGPFGPLQLMAVSESKFVAKNRRQSPVVEFSPGSDGARGRARVEADSLISELDPVGPAPTGDANLSQYPGRYYSEELDVSYSVSLKNGQPFLTRRKHGEQPLQPVCMDEYANNSLGLWEFTRDTTGNVDGALLSTDRVFRLRFSKNR